MASTVSINVPSASGSSRADSFFVVMDGWKSELLAVHPPHAFSRVLGSWKSVGEISHVSGHHDSPEQVFAHIIGAEVRSRLADVHLELRQFKKL